MIESLLQHNNFVKESNRIEGIVREPTMEELKEHHRFVELPKITLDELLTFVEVYQPGAKLRDKPGMNVRVGNHFPPPGGIAIRYGLQELLDLENVLSAVDQDPFLIHANYESLHPFTDCNGRSGRALWAWVMRQRTRRAPDSFLHPAYYQALASIRLLQEQTTGGKHAS